MNLLLHNVQLTVFTVCNIASQLQVHETVVGEKDSHSGAFCLGYLSFSTNNTLLWKHRSGRKYAVYSNKNNFTILMESLNRVPLSCAATAHPTGTALEPCVCCSQQPEAVPLCMSTCASPTRHSHCSHQHNSLKLTPLSPQLSPEMD